MYMYICTYTHTYAMTYAFLFVYMHTCMLNMCMETVKCAGFCQHMFMIRRLIQ